MKKGIAFGDSIIKGVVLDKSESEGIHYEKCSVCGKTREVVIPRLGAPTYQEVNILSHGINNNDHYTSTAMEDGSIKVRI